MLKRNKNCRFTIEEEKEIIEKYLNGSGGTILGKEYSCSPDTIRNILKAHNIKRRSLKEARRTSIDLDEKAFEEITNPEQSYWVGFIYADGYLSKTNKYTNYFGISVAERDIDILHKFKSFLKYNGEIKHYTQTSGFSNNSKYVRLLIGSNKIVSDLEKYGVVQNKSLLIDSMPEIPFLNDFIRGVIDGDGSIRKSNGQLRISGNYNFLKEIGDYLKEPYNLRKDKTIYSLEFSLSSSRKILKKVYSNSTVYLERKYKLANTFSPLT